MDVTTRKQWYHQVPTTLNQVLRQEIDRIDANADPHTNNLDSRDPERFLIIPPGDTVAPSYDAEVIRRAGEVPV